MSRGVFIALAAGIFAAVFALTWVVFRPRIERDLFTRTQKVLNESEMRTKHLGFSGRDATLQIDVEAGVDVEKERKRARKLTESVFGVRVASVIAQVQEKATPSLHVERTGENILLSGVLPDEQTKRLFLEGAATTFAGMTIVDKFRVSEAVASPAYLPALVAYQEVLTRTAPEGTLDLQGTELRVSGDVPNQAAQAAVETLAKEKLPAGLNLTLALRPGRMEPERKVAKDYRREIESTRLHFHFNSTELTQETLYQVEPLLEMIKGQPEVGLRIIGHADAKGSDAYNMDLSRRRAEAIVALFQKQGVNGTVQTLARGERMPCADNATDEGRARNRRVEFEILGGTGE